MVIKFLFLFFISFYLFSQSNQSNTIQEQVALLEKKFEQGSYYDVTQNGEILKRRFRNNYALSKVLILAYLEQGNFSKAKEEITALRSWSDGENITFLEAVISFYEGQYAEAERVLNTVIGNNPQYSEAYLWLAKIYYERDLIDLANDNLSRYAILTGENLEWFKLKGLILLKDITNQRANLREHLNRFQSSYPNNPIFYYLNSQYFLQINNFRRALSNIERAISFDENYFPYLKEKIKILFLSKRWDELLKFIGDLKTTSLEHRKFIYRLEAFINLRNNQNSSTLFGLKNRNDLPRVIKPLENILVLDEEDEWTRFFLEEIILANTSVRDSLREKYAAFHLKESEKDLTLGKNQFAIDHLRRGIKLNPVNYELRKNYSDYLKNSNRLEDYYEELQILKSFAPEQDIFSLDAKIERLKRDIDKYIYTTYNDDYVPQENIIYYLTLNNETLAEQFEFPYYEVVLARMILEKINQSFKVSGELIFNSQAKDILSEANSFKENFFINFKGNESGINLDLGITISDSKQGESSINLFGSGNERYQSVMDRLLIVINDRSRIVGDIVDVRSTEVITSVGSLKGAKQGDLLAVIHQGNQLGELEITDIENYFSRTRPISRENRSTFSLSRILKKGFMVELIPE